jgi:hypothetical protein
MPGKMSSLLLMIKAAPTTARIGKTGGIPYLDWFRLIGGAPGHYPFEPNINYRGVFLRYQRDDCKQLKDGVVQCGTRGEGERYVKIE